MHNINICFVIICGVKCSSLPCRSELGVFSAAPLTIFTVSSISAETRLLMSESLDTVCAHVLVAIPLQYNLTRDRVSKSYPTITPKVENLHLIKDI